MWPMMRRLIERFRKDRKGNFALMTAFAFPAVFAGVALAIDGVNLLRLRTELQNANDTAALFATRYYQVYQRMPTDGEVLGFAQANYKSGTVSGVTVTLNRDTNTVSVTSATATRPMLIGYFGQGSTGVEATSSAMIGVNGALEFALALDTTASMTQDNRIGGLKNAARNFVNVLYDMKDRGADVKGAIVPFSRYVNVGVSRRNVPWMDVPDDIDTRRTERICEVTRPVVGQTNCRMVFIPASTRVIPPRPAQCWDSDGFQVCRPAEPGRTEQIPARNDRVCDPIYGNETTVCRNQTRGELITWKGCVSSREAPYNLRDGFETRRFPGVLGVDCADELLPLTTSRNALLSKIGALSPRDNTYIPEGIMWGLRTLSQGAPFTEGRTAAPGGRLLRKALIVMTDGKNTLSPVNDRNGRSANGIVHTGNNENEANRLTADACDVAKDAETEVYTISFGNQVPSGIRSLLEDCATQPAYYFHASDAAALNAAFQNIADNLLAVRLTQ
jgi:Flp pilus assembly protein TadG